MTEELEMTEEELEEVEPELEEIEPELDSLPDEYFSLDQSVIDTPKWRLSPVSRPIVVSEEVDDVGCLLSRLAALWVPGNAVYVPECLKHPVIDRVLGERVEVQGGYARYRE